MHRAHAAVLAALLVVTLVVAAAAGPAVAALRAPAIEPFVELLAVRHITSRERIVLHTDREGRVRMSIARDLGSHAVFGRLRELQDRGLLSVVDEEVDGEARAAASADCAAAEAACARGQEACADVEDACSGANAGVCAGSEAEAEAGGVQTCVHVHVTDLARLWMAAASLATPTGRRQQQQQQQLLAVLPSALAAGPVLLVLCSCAPESAESAPTTMWELSRRIGSGEARLRCAGAPDRVVLKMVCTSAGLEVDRDMGGAPVLASEDRAHALDAAVAAALFPAVTRGAAAVTYEAVAVWAAPTGALLAGIQKRAFDAKGAAPLPGRTRRVVRSVQYTGGGPAGPEAPDAQESSRRLQLVAPPLLFVSSRAAKAGVPDLFSQEPRDGDIQYLAGAPAVLTAPPQAPAAMLRQVLLAGALLPNDDVHATLASNHALRILPEAGAVHEALAHLLRERNATLSARAMRMADAWRGTDGVQLGRSQVPVLEQFAQREGGASSGSSAEPEPEPEPGLELHFARLPAGSTVASSLQGERYTAQVPVRALPAPLRVGDRVAIGRQGVRPRVFVVLLVTADVAVMEAPITLRPSAPGQAHAAAHAPVRIDLDGAANDDTERYALQDRELARALPPGVTLASVRDKDPVIWHPLGSGVGDAGALRATLLQVRRQGLLDRVQEAIAQAKLDVLAEVLGEDAARGRVAAAAQKAVAEADAQEAAGQWVVDVANPHRPLVRSEALLRDKYHELGRCFVYPPDASNRAWGARDGGAWERDVLRGQGKADLMVTQYMCEQSTGTGIHRPGHERVWDRPCQHGSECPFYGGLEGRRGGCLRSGYCDLPLGTQAVGFKRYAGAPMCHADARRSPADAGGPCAQLGGPDIVYAWGDVPETPLFAP